MIDHRISRRGWLLLVAFLGPPCTRGRQQIPDASVVTSASKPLASAGAVARRGRRAAQKLPDTDVLPRWWGGHATIEACRVKQSSGPTRAVQTSICSFAAFRPW